MKEILKKIRKRLKNLILGLTGRAFVYPVEKYNLHNLSFSQEGEDMILQRIFADQETGFYVDVGAHHPQRFSNTYLFYLKGWRGINIDAMPGSMQLFKQLRPEDINVEAAISDTNEELIYYMFDEYALNGFDEDLMKTRNLTKYQLLEKRLIKTRKLSQVLDQYLPENQVIDFMSIDVEGLDKNVLISNDWQKYRPKFVLVEELNSYFYECNTKSVINDFMSQIKYSLFARTFNTSIYRSNEIHC